MNDFCSKKTYRISVLLARAIVPRGHFVVYHCWTRSNGGGWGGGGYIASLAVNGRLDGLLARTKASMTRSHQNS